MTWKHAVETAWKMAAFSTIPLELWERDRLTTNDPRLLHIGVGSFKLVYANGKGGAASGSPRIHSLYYYDG